MDRELLDLLCSPDTRQPLALLEPAALEALNRAIAAGQVKRADGSAQAAPLREALDRNGFVAPGAGAAFPTTEPAPALMDGRAPALLAHVERPQPGFLPPQALQSIWSAESTSATLAGRLQ